MTKQMTKQSIIFIIVIAISSYIGMSIANHFISGQIVTRGQIDRLNADIEKKEYLEELLNYCFLHADRPNPLQDLLDKGFLSESFKGQTCLSVKQMHNDIQIKISEQQTIINEQKNNDTIEFNRETAMYKECMNQNNMTVQECLDTKLGKPLGER